MAEVSLNGEDCILEAQNEVSRLRDELQILRGSIRELNQYLSAANQRFDSIMQNLPVASYTCDLHGNVITWNSAAVELFGYAVHEAMSRPIWSVHCYNEAEQDQEFESSQRNILQRISNGEVLIQIEQAVPHPSGEMLTILGNIFPVRTNSEEIVGAMFAWIDITRKTELEKQVEIQMKLLRDTNSALMSQKQELAAANTLLAQLVTQDSLTGLNNRRYFMDQVEHALSYYHRSGTPFSVVILDIEDFLGYNRDYGTKAGDEVLQSLARLLRESVRPYDVVARYDGEEFSILAQGSNEVGALAMAARVMKIVHSHPWSPAPISVQCGIASADPNLYSALELMENMETALRIGTTRGTGSITAYSTKLAILN